MEKEGKGWSAKRGEKRLGAVMKVAEGRGGRER
jgi:hypothetical protein